MCVKDKDKRPDVKNKQNFATEEPQPPRTAGS